MSQNQPHVKDLYYTAAQARAVLGLNDNTFHTWVKTGRVNRIMLPGHGKGVYLKSEIDSKLAQIQAALFFEESRDFEYRQATISDMDAENQLAHLVFGKLAVTPQAIEHTRRLARISPESTYHLYDKKLSNCGSLAASINFVPLTHGATLEFIAGKRGWLFGEESITRFEPGGPLECIIIDFMSNPCVPPDRRTNYAKVLLMRFVGITLQKWGEKGVEIAKIYANGGTPDGMKLLETAGGKVINIVPSEINPKAKRTIYEVDVSTSQKHFLQPYKKAYAEWQKLHKK
ncbi:MAG TPA: hypothetical protein VHV10_16715 [Ktedonobacteraceae bacterium]|jgi:hypothetical protein|nr:hypothetical protein [Ktedonobacteraceae bacterium]